MKHLGKILIAAGALALSGMGHAAPVATWQATTTGLWAAYSPNAGVTLSNAGKTLSWGNVAPANQSSLVITNPGVQNFSTYLGTTPPQAAPYLANSVTLTHNNKVLPGGSPTLTSATLSVALTLLATSPAGNPFGLQTINYDIRFVETPNTAGACADVNSPVPCNDIFVLLGNPLLNEKFTYTDGIDYFVNAFPLNGNVLSTLADNVCAAAGVANGCTGFTTVENQSNPLPFGLTISTAPLQVPEPGSLALIGLALAGLGFVSRRRSAV